MSNFSNIKKEYNEEKVKRIEILKDFCNSLPLFKSKKTKTFENKTETFENETETETFENETETFENETETVENKKEKKEEIVNIIYKKMKEIAKIPNNVKCLLYYSNHKNELMDDIKYHIYPKIFARLPISSLNEKTQNFYIELQQYLFYLSNKQSNELEKIKESESNFFDVNKFKNNLKKNINKNYSLFTPLTFGLSYLKFIKESRIKINQSCYNEFLENFTVDDIIKIHKNEYLSVNSIGFCIFTKDLKGLKALHDKIKKNKDKNKQSNFDKFDKIDVYQQTKNNKTYMFGFIEAKFLDNEKLNGFIFAIFDYYKSKNLYLEHRKDKIKDYYLEELYKSYDILEYVCKNLSEKPIYQGRSYKSFNKFGTYEKNLNLLVNTINNNTKVLKNIDYLKRQITIFRKSGKEKKYEKMTKLNKIFDLIFKKKQTGGIPSSSNNTITYTEERTSIICTIQSSLLLIITTGLIVSCIYCMGKIMIEFPGPVHAPIRNFLFSVIIIAALTVEVLFFKLLECDMEYYVSITRIRTNEEKLRNEKRQKFLYLKKKIESSNIKKKAFYKNYLNTKYHIMKDNLYSKIKNQSIQNDLFFKEFYLFSNYKSFERKHNEEMLDKFKNIEKMLIKLNEKKRINKYKFIKTFSNF